MGGYRYRIDKVNRKTETVEPIVLDGKSLSVKVVFVRRRGNYYLVVHVDYFCMKVVYSERFCWIPMPCLK